MRALLISAAASLLVVAGCNDDNNRLASLEGTVGELARMKAQLASLQQQLAALPQPVDVGPLQAEINALKSTVAALPPPFDPKPINDRLDALEAKVGAMTPKLPHFIVAKTGEDLGQVVVGDLDYATVWSPKLKGEIAVTTAFVVLYDQPNCVGNPYTRGQRQDRFFNTGLGTVYRVAGAPLQVQMASARYTQGNCDVFQNSVNATPVVDTGTANVQFDSEELRLEMR